MDKEVGGFWFSVGSRCRVVALNSRLATAENHKRGESKSESMGHWIPLAKVECSLNSPAPQFEFQNVAIIAPRDEPGLCDVMMTRPFANFAARR